MVTVNVKCASLQLWSKLWCVMFEILIDVKGFSVFKDSLETIVAKQ